MIRNDRTLHNRVAQMHAELPPWMPRYSFSQNTLRGDVLVLIFLRGGADSMNMIVPFAEDNYYAMRPKIGISRPDDTSKPQEERARDLDGFFGLHPAGEPLRDIFANGHMTALHAVGSPDKSRSHFEAQMNIEIGTFGKGGNGTGGGWLGRFLTASPDRDGSPVRAVTWGAAPLLSMQGALSAVAMKSITDYHLPGDKKAAVDMLAALNSLYQTAAPDLRHAAEMTQMIAALNVGDYTPHNSVKYADANGKTTSFDYAMMQTAALIRADAGLEVAAVDLGGWDNHQNERFFFTNALRTLSNGLRHFYDDMADEMSRVTVVVMSEFGRRLQENASGGTDHGNGGAMLVMNGGGLSGTPVIAKWPGLTDEVLDFGDLKPTMDYRDVITEVLQTRLKFDNTAMVFPGYTATVQGVFD